MSGDEEDLAIMLLLKQTHGEHALVWIAEQIGRLALEGDAAGIARWKGIASIWTEHHRALLQ